MKNIIKFFLGIFLLNIVVKLIDDTTTPSLRVPSSSPNPPKDKKVNEQEYILSLINELKDKKNKNQKDKNNLGLLEVKLKQLLTQ